MSTDGDRPFPPSARRIGLAHRAGLSPASPLVVGAAAWIAALVAISAIGAASARALTGWIAAAMTAADGIAHPRATLAIADTFDVALATVLPIGA
ncbi:MAG: hypothetical protein NT062_20195, partial [Proteobacteria bacterium]|nr:hypothetical protein [Pseudomonadota bacterium]